MNFNQKLAFFKEHTVVNWHEHVWLDQSGKLNRPQSDKLVEHARLTGMDTLVVSQNGRAHV